ncbi:MAG: CBS domain-containing protein [Acidimicrobiia bacterium]|nr:CBS domain-containing protein [Acidimicrobiia bacterium]
MRLESLVGGKATIVGPEATLAEAAEHMVETGVDSVAVVAERSLVGILTEHDLVVAVADGADLEDELVKDWMTESPDTIAPDIRVREAVIWLMQTGYRHLPVVDGSELLGIVSVRDLLWAIAGDE